MNFIKRFLLERSRQKLLTHCQEFITLSRDQQPTATENLLMIKEIIPRFIKLFPDISVSGERLVRISTHTRSLAELKRRAGRVLFDYGSSATKHARAMKDRSLYDFYAVGEGDTIQTLTTIANALVYSTYCTAREIVSKDPGRKLEDLNQPVCDYCYDLLVFIYTYTKHSEINK